jgi:hypothetical protein
VLIDAVDQCTVEVEEVNRLEAWHGSGV